jgi:hypothetical protein
MAEASDALTVEVDAGGGVAGAEHYQIRAEIETAVFLEESGFVVTLEPFAPDKGADIRADFDQKAYYLEVRSVGDSEEDDRFNSVSSEMFAMLNGIASHYSADITVGEEYTPRGPRLREAKETVRKSLEILEEEQWPRATLYYSPEGGSLLNPSGDYTGGSGGARERAWQAVVDSADFVVRFRHHDQRSEKTPAIASRPFERIPVADQTHARLQKIMKKKREQLPKNSRGLIVIECSDLFMLTDFSISAALYGDLMVRFDPVGPGEPVGDPIPYRNARGLFAKTSRVSAVLFHRRFVAEGEVQHDWQVYPTNRANPDTIRLSGAELGRFGNLGERESLTSEEAPNSSL